MRESEWPAVHVEMWPVASLVPYARNARKHSAAQVSQIAASIREFGWTVPCLVDEEGGLIAGHGRVLAAQKLGITSVPVMVARGWTKVQKQAYILTDNKLTLNGEWDDSLLKIEVLDIGTQGFNLSLTGFSDAEITDITLGLQPLVDDLDTDWDGMPETGSAEQPAFRKIVVSFRSQEDVDRFARQIGQTLGRKTKMIWYPGSD